MEHKIGEVFEDGGVKLKVEKSTNGCFGCHFLHVTNCANSSTCETCNSLERKDKTNVIFVKVKDNTNNNNDMETRNIKLNLKTAKEWFKGSDETLKKLALQAYKEEELKDNLPNSWEEFCKQNKYANGDFYINEKGCIRRVGKHLEMGVYKERNLNASAEAHLALLKLEQLRDCYRNGWKPDWEGDEKKFVIYYFKNEIEKRKSFNVSRFLSFQTMELCDKFFDNFKDLIETAKEYI